MKSPKELHCYIWFIQIIIIIFLIFSIVLMYNNRIHIFYNLVIILLFIIVIFIQNYLIIDELLPRKEGLVNYDCFKLYSKYVTNQYQTDVYDISLNKLIQQIKMDIANNTTSLNNYSSELTTKLSAILDTISNNIKSVMEKANAWNGQYTTTLKGMNNMMNSLYYIQQNLDPRQYPDSTTNFIIT